MDKCEWKELLEIFMPSADIRNYLLDYPMEKDKAAEIIWGSPVSIHEKCEWLGRIGDEESCQDYKHAIEELEIKDGEFFYLKDLWFDDEILDTKQGGGMAFTDLDKVKEYIRYDLDVDGREDDYEHYGCDENEIKGKEWLAWYELEKWTQGKDGNYENRFTYYMVRDEIMYFDINELDDDGMIWTARMPYTASCSMDLNLPVPFEVGDIVKIDCTPFKPATLGIILEVGDNKDCCCVQALVKNEGAMWMSGAVKHTSLFRKRSTEGMSALYRIERYDDELPDKYMLLNNVHEYINGDEKVGAEIGEYCSRLIHESQLISFLRTGFIRRD